MAAVQPEAVVDVVLAGAPEAALVPEHGTEEEVVFPDVVVLVAFVAGWSLLAVETCV